MDSITNYSNSPSVTAITSFEPTSPSSSSGNTVTSGNNSGNNNNNSNNNNTSINVKSQSPKPSKVKHAPVHYTDDDYLPSTRVKATRVRPEMDSSLSNDTILLDILNILYDNESGNELENGFTVKQICDKLLEKDPKMIDLSTKFANLISAKINAYAKKVENRVRGDFNVNIKYWIIRKWAKGNSPKRMVYIYKGLLPADYSETPPPTPPTPPAGSSNTKTSSSVKKNDNESGHSQKKFMMQESVKRDTMHGHNSKSVNYNKLMSNNNGNVNKNGLSNAGSNKFSINLNRFQQFGYKMNNNSNSSTPSQLMNNIPKQQQQNNVTSNNSKLINDKKTMKPLISGIPRIGMDNNDTNNNGNGNDNVKKIDSLKIAQQIQLIQKSIQQISPVQKITKNNHRHQEQQSLQINRKWMETLQSGFMYEEILSPDNMKLSDFDTLFN